jgi:general secretion pathway protein B
MSYILDALRKSEEERRRKQGEALLQLPHKADVRKRGRIVLWIFLFTGALAVNAMLLLVRPQWLQFTSHPAPDAGRASQSASPAALPAAPEMDGEAPLPSEKKEKPSLGAVDSEAGGTSGGEAASAGVADEKVVGAKAEWKPDPDRIYTLHELPPAIRETLPSFEISVFFFSDEPASRVVRINGVSLREGDELTEGLKVEKIREKSIIFRTVGYRLQIVPRQG